MESMQDTETLYLDSFEIAFVSRDMEGCVVRVIRGGGKSSSDVIMSA